MHDKKYSTARERHKLATYCIYAFARATIAFFRICPQGLAAAFIRLLATCTYYVDGHHRHIARVNLKIAFPSLSARERSRIARRSFQSTGMNLLVVSKFPTLTPENISDLAGYDPVNGLSNYLAGREKGKGVLYITGHFSAWELLPSGHALHGYPLSFVTRPLDNALFDSYLIRIRESKGNRVLNKKNSARQILKELKSNGGVGILMDQNVSAQEGIFADFFGIPACTTPAVAFLALHSDASVVPGFLSPLRNGRFTINFRPPVDLVRTGDMAKDLATNTRRFNEIMERIIREQPDSWLWGHKRWKHQPEGNPQDLYSLSEQELDEFLRAKQKLPRMDTERTA
jgi:KDO2-lipid IV(A) lauroyltransferase